MKKSLRSLLIGTAILAAPQIASATLLVGFHQFNNAQNTVGSPETPHTADIESGFSAGIIESTASNNTGGSTDLILGQSHYNMGAGAYNDGYASIKSITNPGLTMTLTNSTGFSYTLDNLYYDAVASFAKSSLKGVDVGYKITGDVGTTALSSVRSMYQTTFAEDDFTDYADTIVNLLDQAVVLGSGQTISFFFTMVGSTGGEVRIDNLGIDGHLTAVPEPGSLLALGCVVGSGAFLRSRRRSARVA